MRSLMAIFVAFTAAVISATPVQPVQRFTGTIDCDYFNGKPCSATTQRGCCNPGVTSAHLSCDPLEDTLYVANGPYNAICDQEPQG